jgi:hypothetical protein
MNVLGRTRQENRVSLTGIYTCKEPSGEGLPERRAIPALRRTDTVSSWIWTPLGPSTQGGATASGLCRHGVPAPLQAKNWGSAALAGMSLWQSDEPDGGTNPRGSIAEKVHAPVPPPRGLLLRCSLIGPFVGGTWNSCRARPSATPGGNAAGASTRRRSSEEARTEGVARKRTSRRR